MEPSDLFVNKLKMMHRGLYAKGNKSESHASCKAAQWTLDRYAGVIDARPSLEDRDRPDTITKLHVLQVSLATCVSEGGLCCDGKRAMWSPHLLNILSHRIIGKYVILSTELDSPEHGHSTSCRNQALAARTCQVASYAHGQITVLVDNA